jgi:4-diphosphocytidyl-2-C-methyl-D-erythritol kinase
VTASLAALWNLPAPAKLNLFLHVVGRRADGYHLLQSVFVLIDWADTIHLERRTDGALRRHDLGPGLPADDLSLRAARALQQASGTTLGADLSVLKRVPWGAGLGGGSSDAATVLLGLNRLWGLHWPRERLLQLATPLGADVPFFVGGHNAFVEGIGDRLTPIEVPPAWFAVAKPEEGVPTVAIFSAPDLARDTDPAIVTGSLAAPPRDGKHPVPHLDPQLEARCRNDLQPVAERICPAIVQVAQHLAQRFGNARMTGSGSAVFSRVSSEFARTGMGEQPVATWPEGALPDGWVGRLCRSLPRHPLADWCIG